MNMRPHAILAVVLHVAVIPVVPVARVGLNPPGAAAAAAAATSPASLRSSRDAAVSYRVMPDTPVRISVQLVDGYRLSGDLTAWSNEGIDGSFGRHAWETIRHEDVWRMHRQLMDQADPLEWVRLGGVMLRLAATQPGAADRAERAFRTAAERSDDPPDDAIVAVRRAAEMKRRREIALKRLTNEHRLRVASPAARQWPAQRWPVLSGVQQSHAARSSRNEAQNLLREAGVDLPAFESAHFILHVSMTTDEAKRWTETLEVMYRGVGDLLGFDASYNVFHGKCIVIVFDDHERFRLVEAAMFNQYTPVSEHGVMHADGTMTAIVTHRDRSDEAFADELARQVARAVLHRHRSPHRLPLWANEGLARYFAARAFEDTPADLARRDRALAFIRSGGDVHAALSVTYDDVPWPDDEHLPSELGHLMIELMVRERPDAFRRWIAAVKRGTEWEEALREDYGVALGALVATFAQYFTVND
jgi:hypothetical protein